MAKIHGIGTQISGKVGQIIYRQTKYGTVAYESPAKPATPRRSEKQMEQRTQLANLGAVYSQFNPTLKHAFEGLNGMTDYNAFVQANMGVCRVFLPKQMRLNGGCVLAPYQITRGTLPSIAMGINGNDVLVTNISLGSLTVNANTSVAEFSLAVIRNNPNWDEGDQLTFFYGIQTIDAVTSVPRASITGYKVVLNTTDATPLWAYTDALGFCNVDGMLGMSQPATDSAAAWIHSRLDANGNLRVSTQFLYVDSSVLDRYQTDEAFTQSADSYGGINTNDVFLQPNGTDDIVLRKHNATTSNNKTED